MTNLSNTPIDARKVHMTREFVVVEHRPGAGLAESS
jgi:hypothetical protein